MKGGGEPIKILGRGQRKSAKQDRAVRSPIGLGFVFLNVLVQQLGAPVPAVPTLVVAGAVATR